MNKNIIIVNIMKTNKRLRTKRKSVLKKKKKHGKLLVQNSIAKITSYLVSISLTLYGK